MKGGDRVTELYVTRVLEAHGIQSVTQGSIGWSTSVPASQRAEAERLLRAELPLRGFVTWLPSGETEHVVEAPGSSVAVDRGYADALVMFPQTTLVGRILRSADLLDEMRGLEHVRVKRVSWQERNLVTKDLKPSRAITATVSILDSDKMQQPMDCDVLLLDEGK